LFWLILQQHQSSINLAISLGLFFSVLVPAVFLIVRHDMRTARIKAAELFRKSLPEGRAIDLHFDFVRSKYADGCSVDSNGQAKNFPLPRFPAASDWLLLLAAAPFILLTASGFFILFLPASELPQLLGGSLGASILSVGGLSETAPKDYENAVAIAALAFAGGFLYCMRLFLGSLFAFELSAVTFLRAFAHMLFAIMLATVIWRAAPGGQPLAPGIMQQQSAAAADRKATARPAREGADAPSPAGPQPVSKLWLLLAFAAGFMPDAAFAWMLSRARVISSRGLRRLSTNAATAPLTIIDGIDFLTAYRLDERKIANVQNLASANPIMLHVETSVSIYTIMDWVAQAQLCARVGPQRFLLLRRLNIRTIFDLERAVLDPSAPLGLKQMTGAVLLANDGKSNLLRDFGIRPLHVTYRDFDKTVTSWVNVEVVEHLVRLVMDDLYVHRLRQIWQDIEASLHSAKPADQPRPPLTVPQPAMKHPALSNGQRHGGEVPFGIEAVGEL
jgi:hypothetical protein